MNNLVDFGNIIGCFHIWWSNFTCPIGQVNLNTLIFYLPRASGQVLVLSPDVVRCHGSHECWFMHRQFHSWQHSLRITLKSTTAVVPMRSGDAWTMKSWQRSKWHLGFNSVSCTQSAPSQLCGEHSGQTPHHRAHTCQLKWPVTFPSYRVPI